jgi:peptide methionine sulfoxide reductase MsrB
MKNLFTALYVLLRYGNRIQCPSTYDPKDGVFKSLCCQKKIYHFGKHVDAGGGWSIKHV